MTVSKYSVVYVINYVCTYVYVYRVIQPPSGDPWLLGHGLANHATWDRWTDVPFYSLHIP